MPKPNMRFKMPRKISRKSSVKRAGLLVSFSNLTCRRRSNILQRILSRLSLLPPRPANDTARHRQTLQPSSRLFLAVVSTCPRCQPLRLPQKSPSLLQTPSSSNITLSTTAGMACRGSLIPGEARQVNKHQTISVTATSTVSLKNSPALRRPARIIKNASPRVFWTFFSLSQLPTRFCLSSGALSQVFIRRGECPLKSDPADINSHPISSLRLKFLLEGLAWRGGVVMVANGPRAQAEVQFRRWEVAGQTEVLPANGPRRYF